jgi:hypothetical protein
MSMDRDELNGSDLDHSCEADSSANRDWCSLSEDDWQIGRGAYLDIDDEVEDSNAIDDSYKILKGDW